MTVTPGEMDPWMSTASVAELFEVTTETVRNWIDQGHFGDATVQINGYWRIRKSAVIAFANKKYGKD